MLYLRMSTLFPPRGLCMCQSHWCRQFCIRSLHSCLLIVYVSDQVSSQKGPLCVTLPNVVAPLSPSFPSQITLCYFFIWLMVPETVLCVCSLARVYLPNWAAASMRVGTGYLRSLLLPPVPGGLRKTWWIKTSTYPHTKSYPHPRYDHCSYKEAQIKAKRPQCTLFVKNPCPAPTLLNVSSVFEYWGFPPGVTGDKRHKVKFKINSYRSTDSHPTSWLEVSHSLFSDEILNPVSWAKLCSFFAGHLPGSPINPGHLRGSVPLLV